MALLFFAEATFSKSLIFPVEVSRWSFGEAQALSLHRSKTALGAAFRRIARHKSGDVAVFAIARKLAQLIYRMLRYGHDYVDIGEHAYELQFRARRFEAIKDAAKSLGYLLVPTTQEAQSA